MCYLRAQNTGTGMADARSAIFYTDHPAVSQTISCSKYMPKIIFDTSIGTTNLGDHIIMDAVNRISDELFMDDFVINAPTHFSIHPKDLHKLRKYDTGIVGGTNLLKNDTLRKSQWKVGIKDLLVLRPKVVLLGVGWWQYQEKPVSAYSRMMYTSLFSKRYLHYVRDHYTLQKLAEIGNKNVNNTRSPTQREHDK